MTAEEKIYIGMRFMKEGCAEATINYCQSCPFYAYCIGQPIDAPEDWEPFKKTT